MSRQFTPEQLNAVNVINQNALISAGAGSGKTTVLTERIIRLISRENDPISLDSMLVMTFTKLAAENMKNRIREELGKDDKYKEELKKLDSSYICTFDSFTSSLIRKYNYLLNVSKNISIMPNNIELAKKIEIIQALFADKFIIRDKSFLRLVDNYCFKDDKPLQDIILKLNNSLDKLSNKKEYLMNYFENHYTVEWFDELKNDYYDYILNIKKSLAFLGDNVLACYEEQKAGYQENSEKFARINEATTYDDIRESALEFKFSLKRDKKNEGYDKAKDLYNAQLKILKSLVSYEALDEAISISEQELESIKTIVSILIELEERLDKYKMDHQVFTFADISKMAISLLKNNEDIRKEVSEEFEIIMIDEYQDTSDIQDELVNLISRNNVYMVGDVKQSIYRFRNANPNIFKGRYDSYDKYDETKTSEKGAVIDLLKNFRSRKEVVEDINKIFNIIMSDNVGGANYIKQHQMIFGNPIYEKYNCEKQDYHMDIINYNNIREQLENRDIKLRNEEIEAIVVANDIQYKIDNKFQILDGNSLRDCKKSDFCIIVDVTTNFETYRKIFEYFGIPLKVCRKEKLNNGYDLKVIVNIMKFILAIKNKQYDANFRYLFTSIARSFVCKYSDEYIYDVVKNESLELLFNDQLYQKSFSLAKELEYLSSKEFVQRIIDDFDLYEAYYGFDNIDKAFIEFEYLINSANALESIGLNIDSMIEYFEMIKNNDDLKEEYEVNSGQNDAVTLINTHLSKGLEYSVCYYIGLNNNYRTVDNKAKMCLDDDYGFIYYKKMDNEKDNDSTAYKELYKNKEIKESISEKIRLFYVALTRTKEKMIFVDCFNPDELEDIDQEYIDEYKLKIKNHHDLMSFVYTRLNDRIIDCNVDIDLFNDKYKYIDNSKSELNKEIEKDNKTIEVSEIVINSKIIEGDTIRFSKKKNELIDSKTKEKLVFGEEVHYYLEMLNFENSKEKLYDSIDKYNCSDLIKLKLKAFINCDLMKDVINAKAYKEHEFIMENDNEEGIGIIDLLLEYDDKYVIIDYKLKNIDDVAYHKQLAGYANYISQNNPNNKMIEAYLYSILDERYEKII